MKVYNVVYFSSPLQDDFIVLHIPGEYDSVLETVFKTEFLTLLSSKYQDSLSRQLKVDITSRYDDKSKRLCARCPLNGVVSQNTCHIPVSSQSRTVAPNTLKQVTAVSCKPCLPNQMYRQTHGKLKLEK